MKTPTISILLFVIAALIGAFGQYLYKTGADLTNTTFKSYIFNSRLIGGIICYVAVMVLFVMAFKKGGELSVLYPIYATTFIWGALIALLVFGTPIKPVNIAGMGLLLIGMYLMGK